MMMRRFLMLGVALIAMMSAGCAITDYDGLAGRQTAAEAKLWGTEIAFSGTGDPALDGTYSYTVKFDNRGGRDVNMRIFTYRNPVVGSFSRDGLVDRDGDDIQGRGGILGGKFSAYWTVTDPLPGCQFFANRIQSHDQAPPPGIALCDTVEEEVDKDLDLQASFASTGDLLAQIWSGAVSGGFTMEVNGVVINGVNVPVSPVASIGAISTGIRPARFSVDLSQPGGQALIQAILNNTSDGVPVSFGLRFEGGMAVDLPARINVAFNHTALQNML